MEKHTPDERTATQRAKTERGEPEGLLDVQGLAVRLGVTPRHVRRLIAERRIPFIKWGHLVRFDPGDVEEWIAQQRIAAVSTHALPRSGTVR